MQATRQQKRRSRTAHAGFTMLEVLIVIVVLASTTAVVSLRLAQIDATVQLRRAASDWTHLDGYARLISAQDRPMHLRVGGTGGTGQGRLLILEPDRRIERAAMLSRAVPHSVELILDVDRKPFHTTHQRVNCVRYDTRGRSDDYRVAFRLAEDQSTRPLMLECSGITGEIIIRQREESEGGGLP